MTDLSITNIIKRLQRLEEQHFGNPGPDEVTGTGVDRLESDLDAQGNAIKNAGSFGTESATVEQAATGANDIPRFDQLKTVVSRGEVFADDGELYDHPDDAEQAATDFIQLGPGEFPNFSVDTANLTVQGAGYGTVISPPDNFTDTIVVSADDVQINSLRVVGNSKGILTSGNGLWLNRLNIDSSRGVAEDTNGGNHATIENCRFTSGTVSTNLGTGLTVRSCLFDNAGRLDAYSGGFCVIENNTFRGGNDYHSIKTDGGDCIITGNHIHNRTSTNQTVLSLGNNPIISDNYVVNDSTDTSTAGIEIQGTDALIANNQSHTSGGTPIDTSAATTPTLDNNITS